MRAIRSTLAVAVLALGLLVAWVGGAGAQTTGTTPTTRPPATTSTTGMAGTSLPVTGAPATGATGTAAAGASEQLATTGVELLPVVNGAIALIVVGLGLLLVTELQRAPKRRSVWSC